MIPSRDKIASVMEFERDPVPGRLSILLNVRNRSRQKVKYKGQSISLFLLPNCIEAIVNAAEGLKNETEIVIADWYSDDWPLEEWLDQAVMNSPVNTRIVYVSRQPFNRSRGRNIAAFHSSGEYLFFLDVDILVPSAFFLQQGIDIAARGAVAAPVYFGFSGPEHDRGNWWTTAMGCYFMTRRTFSRTGCWKAAGRWKGARMDIWGNEDREYMWRIRQKNIPVVRKRYQGFNHQWHPRNISWKDKEIVGGRTRPRRKIPGRRMPTELVSLSAQNVDRHRISLSSPGTRHIVILCPFSNLTADWHKNRKPFYLRMAKIMAGSSCNPGFKFFICEWHRFRIVNQNLVMRGKTLLVTENHVRFKFHHQFVKVDALFYFAQSGCAPVPQSCSEEQALKHWHKLSIPEIITGRHDLLSRLMSYVARSGIAGNATAQDGIWGRKDQLEMILRKLKQSSGLSIPRPKTIIANGHQVPFIVRKLHNSGQTCIIKPVNSSRARGIRVVKPGDEPAAMPKNQLWIVQYLERNPFTVNGRKCDLRFYMRVTSSSAPRMKRVGPILIRSAAAGLIHGELQSEITNTSYTKYDTAETHIRPLADAGLGASTVTGIENACDELSLKLREGFLYLNRIHHQPAGGLRVMLWGIDALMAKDKGNVDLKLLEVNVHPQLFRDEPLCDDLVTKMLQEDYFPQLWRHFPAPTALQAGHD